MPKHPTELPRHLGGHAYITHLDESSFQYIVDKYQIKTMIDVGCGPGGMIRHALSKGIDAEGIDGDFTLDFSDLNVVLHDFTKGPYEYDKTFDLGWSVEFVEHVKPEFVDNYMKVFQKAKYVLMTHAHENNVNPYHFNLKPSSYWIDLFESYGFEFCKEETDHIRGISSMKRDFIRHYGHFFINKEL